MLSLLQLFNFFSGYAWLIVFFVFIQLLWIVRLVIARKNKRYEEQFTGNVAVILAVLRENPKVFEKCLNSIKKYGNPQELIVSIDDYSHADNEIKRIAEKYATRVIEQPRFMGKREQYAIVAESLKENIDVIITVDSDTIWDASTTNILKPFNNPKVGAVSGRQTIFETEGNVARRVAQWFEDIRFTIILPFQSYFGQVNIVPGRTLAARANVYKEVIQHVRKETFLGRRLIIGDDISVTMDILRAGYDVVYQEDSNVTTDAPNTLRKFITQYLRWYRSLYRTFYSRLRQMMSMHPLVFLSNIEFLFMTFVYGAVFFVALFGLAFNAMSVMEMIWFLVLFFLGALLVFSIRQLPHLIHERRDTLLLPVFALFLLVTTLPLKLVTLFTMFENSWMTRKSSDKHKEMGITSTRLFTVTMACSALITTVGISLLALHYLKAVVS